MIRAESQKRQSLHFPLLGEPPIRCGRARILCHVAPAGTSDSFEIGMTDIRVAPIDAVLLTDDARRTPRDTSCQLNDGNLETVGHEVPRSASPIGSLVPGFC
jgi:hypothetical protein